MYKLWWRFQSLFEGSLSKQILNSSLKFCRNGKPTNVLKSVNAENKYLFGRLLETQKQRRRSIRRKTQSQFEEENVSERNDPHKKDDTNIFDEETANSNSINKKKKSRSLKSSSKDINDEASQEVPFSSLNPVGTQQAKRPSGHTVQDNNIEIKNPKNVEAIDITNVKHNTSPKKVTKKRLKAQIDGPNPPRPLGQPQGSKIMTEHGQLSFSGVKINSNYLQINEINFPLESKAKPSANKSQTPSPTSFGFNDLEVKSYANFPSVSKIIEETMSSRNRSILHKWKENMIKELGEDGFTKHNLAVKERGARFHSAVRDMVLGRATQLEDEATCEAIRSLDWLMEHISSPLAVESLTAHPALRYRGIPDCVAMFRNVPVVVDWKLSDKPKNHLKDTYDAPVQITAYMGALNHDPNYTWAVNHGLVAVAYTSGEPADVFLLSPEHCRIYWRHWLMRLERFNSRIHLHVEHDIDEQGLSLD